jgi:hypothetical protein
MELKLNHKVATVAVDSSIIVTKRNGSVDLLFLQFTQEGQQPEADVVASVRLTTIDELEELKRTIDEAIEKHKNAEA